jgi:hypothetical protein
MCLWLAGCWRCFQDMIMLGVAGQNLTTSKTSTLKKILLSHILYYQRNDDTFEYHLKSHNSEHNKRFHKKQIPKLLMSFGDGKIQTSLTLK